MTYAWSWDDYREQFGDRKPAAERVLKRKPRVSAKPYDDEIRRLYESGLTCKQVAEKINAGFSFGAVQARLRAMGVAMRPPHRMQPIKPRVSDDTVSALYCAGLSVQMVADTVKQSFWITYQQIKRLGIMRPQGHYGASRKAA